jgi:hypothetical protein
MIVFDLDKSPDRFSLVEIIIDQEMAEAPQEVKTLIATYAQGNPGAARLIARGCKGMTDTASVVAFIGWDAASGLQEAGHDIYDRLKS